MRSSPAIPAHWLLFSLDTGFTVARTLHCCVIPSRSFLIISGSQIIRWTLEFACRKIFSVFSVFTESRKTLLPILFPGFLPVVWKASVTIYSFHLSSSSFSLPSPSSSCLGMRKGFLSCTPLLIRFRLGCNLLTLIGQRQVTSSLVVSLRHRLVKTFPFGCFRAYTCKKTWHVCLDEKHAWNLLCFLEIDEWKDSFPPFSSSTFRSNSSHSNFNLFSIRFIPVSLLIFLVLRKNSSLTESIIPFSSTISQISWIESYFTYFPLNAVSIEQKWHLLFECY